jgi:Fe-S-cluster-containing hydrogenase component 2
MKVKRPIIEIDEDLCDGCGECVPSCAEGAIQVVEGKARLVSDVYCDGLGACLGHCPQGALTLIDREAEEFDEEEVEKLLKSKKQSERPATREHFAGCPSAQTQVFGHTPCETANRPVSHFTEGSALSHWPVQIRLIAPNAPFLRDADLLVAADCTPFAYPDFHRDFMKGRVVLVGCPKLDNAQEYIERFKDIFSQGGIKSVTIAVMEVPCCQAMPRIVEEAMKAAGTDIPVEVVVISTRGRVLNAA